MDARVTEFAVAEAKARFSELLARAEAGEEIMIKRHGRPIVRLTRVKSASVRTSERKHQAVAEFLAWRKAHGPRLVDGETVVDLVRSGRKY